MMDGIVRDRQRGGIGDRGDFRRLLNGKTEPIVNPYQITDTARLPVEGDTPSAPRVRFCIWLLAYLYPLWLASSFYASWLIAWMLLGHRPRPNLDDPKSIGAFMDVTNLLPLLLLMAMPALAPMGLAASFFCPICVRPRLRVVRDLVLAIVYVVLCAVVLFTLRTDPWRVVEWWFD